MPGSAGIGFCMREFFKSGEGMHLSILSDHEFTAPLMTIRTIAPPIPDNAQYGFIGLEQAVFRQDRSKMCFMVPGVDLWNIRPAVHPGEVVIRQILCDLFHNDQSGCGSFRIPFFTVPIPAIRYAVLPFVVNGRLQYFVDPILDAADGQPGCHGYGHCVAHRAVVPVDRQSRQR